MPSGGPCDGSHGGKRCSSGRISTLPSGDSPAMASNTTLVTISQLAIRVNRVHSRMIPRRPSEIRKFVGSAKKPSTLESMKNTAQPRDFRHAA